MPEQHAIHDYHVRRVYEKPPRHILSDTWMTVFREVVNGL
jgi:hypothetical protein